MRRAQAIDTTKTASNKALDHRAQITGPISCASAKRHSVKENLVVFFVDEV